MAKELKEKKVKKEKKDKKEKKEKKGTKRSAEEVDTPAPAAKKTGGGLTNDVAAWRKKHQVTVCDQSDKYEPVSFAHSGMPKDVLKCTESFDEPTAIQAQSWPLIAAKKDVIGIAKTGSGKTYAFMLPGLALAKTMKYQACCPQGLVLAPTRELCLQIAKVGEEAAGHCGLRVVQVYGQVPKDTQRREIRQGANFVIATPGRLKDLLSEGASTLSLKNVVYAVLDEADRMLDMGFEDDVREILEQTARPRQTLMFSATWPPAIQMIAKEFLNKPAKITIGSTDLSANHKITQTVEVVDDQLKYRKLIQLLGKYHGKQENRVIVFGLYKKEVARIENMLWRDGWNCVAIQGDASQAAREEAFRKFKEGESKLLIATDVAARGLDIKGVEHVINVSFPLTVEDYVHRIGRTGRAGAPGNAHTFFTINDKGLAPGLIRVLEEAKQPVPKDLEKWRNVPVKKPPANERNPLESKSGGFKGEIPTGNRETFSDSDDE